MKKLLVVVAIVAGCGAIAYGAYTFITVQQANDFEVAAADALEATLDGGCEAFRRQYEAAKDAAYLSSARQRARGRSRPLFRVVREVYSGCRAADQRELKLALFHVGDIGRDVRDLHDQLTPLFSAQQVADIINVVQRDARDALAARVASKKVADLWQHCERRAVLRQLNLPRYPEILTMCTRNAIRRGHHDRAKGMIGELARLTDDTAATTVPELEQELARAQAAKSERLEKEAGRLPPLQVVGRTDGPPTISIVNASARDLSMQLGKKRYRIPKTKLLPGETFDPIRPCRGKRVTFEQAVDPGTYEVQVRVVGDSKVRPFRGVWKVLSGRAYRQCLYVRTRR